jgi:hypothetical protein
MVGYKLVRLRKNGTIGPLFINRKLDIPFYTWMPAEAHRTKGYKFRPGWHILAKPEAPHLSKKNRVWCVVEFNDYSVEKRPENQGGRWYLAQNMKVVSRLPV